ncbi:hypothetical protein E2C01_056202 [Portunus trituberculatus]|uniref:Uncharacterized protein n=1 Tax=Portunus trituberculatus TaxID=210409 RepID=A0A5B7GX66_PORTR|nr:hypothetical protein [Portunus trituberculatus]
MLLNSFLAYKNQQKYKGDFMTYIIQVSKELVSHHSASARAMFKKEKEEKIHRPRKKVPKADLIHAWVCFQPKKQKKCRIC